MKTILSITILVSLALSIAASASASEPVRDESSANNASSDAPRYRPISAAILVGHGDKDAFKAGIGGRIGYTLRNRIYLGASFVSHFGVQDGPVQANAWYAG